MADNDGGNQPGAAQRRQAELAESDVPAPTSGKGTALKALEADDPSEITRSLRRTREQTTQLVVFFQSGLDALVQDADLTAALRDLLGEYWTKLKHVSVEAERAAAVMFNL